MKTRILSKKLKEYASLYPAVTLVGPRQSGKTTLVRDCFPGHRYINLEALNEREFAESDPVDLILPLLS